MVYVDVSGVSVKLPVFDGRSASLKAHIARLGRRAGRIEVDDARHASIHALVDVDLHLEEGDRVGLIGRNGSGKTTLLRVLAGIYEPTAGTVRISGSTCALLDLTLGMDMEATGFENMYLRGYALGMSHRSIQAAERDIADFTELGAYLALPVRTYSAGMALRLAFAISVAASHDILLMDEVVGAGDAAFLARARRKLDDRMSRARILVVASHASEFLRSTCSKGVYLRQGRIVKVGPIDEVLADYAREPPANGV
ncbi:MAG: ABC transporter ATP-binding protein [Rhodospirillaceae bacterium]|nr:ABC transporter ATP-binding protein [Rhodospirillaceae bacterium]